MTWDQYWNGDVWIIEQYLAAERIRQERINQDAWLQGMYIYEAVLDAAPVLHAFAKKGTNPNPYSDKPYSFRKGKEPDETQIENERLKASLFFENWARANRKIG